MPEVFHQPELVRHGHLPQIHRCIHGKNLRPKRILASLHFNPGFGGKALFRHGHLPQIHRCIPRWIVRGQTWF
jgi:hypothetical protein